MYTEKRTKKMEKRRETMVNPLSSVLGCQKHHLDPKNSENNKKYSNFNQKKKKITRRIQTFIKY
jgi:hypothetical protein